MTRYVEGALWALLFLGLAAFGAWGQTTEAREEADFIGSLTISNEPTRQVDRFNTYSLNGVEVTVHYHSTPNHVFGIDPRDEIRVTVPDGFLAIPAEVLLPEGEAVEIRIYEALLG